METASSALEESSPEVIPSSRTGVLAAVDQPNPPAWTFHAIYHFVTGSATPRCVFQTCWITIPWRKSSNRRLPGSHFSTSAVMPILNFSCALSSGTSSFDPSFHAYTCFTLILFRNLRPDGLISPVCLDRPIYPCRGLCERVRQGCEGRMKTYGYPWPDMLRCDKFPQDNDMCIGPQTTGSSSEGMPFVDVAITRACV